jgi:uncharacterized membrane protein
MKACNIVLALHVNVNQITLSKVVHALSEKVVLHKAALHGEALFGVHIVICSHFKFAFSFAELDSFADSLDKETFVEESLDVCLTLNS